MKRLTMIASSLALAVLIGASWPSTAAARVDVHVGIGIPAPPSVVFEHEPEVVLVPRTRVYYTSQPDYDMYRYGGYWYVNRDGYWYRSSSYNGPFTYVVYDRVPRSIVVVPHRYHHYPVRPIHMEHHGNSRHHDDHGHGGHPHGHGHGHGHD